jgi:hypothetical protein
MKKVILLLALLISEACLAGEYSDCILENMKGVNDRFAAHQVKNACREKALPYIPAKCRDLPTDPPDAFDRFLAKSSAKTNNQEELLITRGECIDKCLNASYWSKHFGECEE